MIEAFIPSKDRAAQCDLLLSSLEKNAPHLFYPVVCWTASNNEFLEGYRKLWEKWHKYTRFKNKPDIDMFLETNPTKETNDFYTWLDYNAIDNRLVALFTDDCIFYRKNNIWEDDLKTIFSWPDMWTFTYRMGQNVVVKDYVINEMGIIPPILNKDQLCMWWDRTQVDFWQLYGFPCCFDGGIYRAVDLLKMTNREYFPRICEFEHLFCKNFQKNPPSANFISSPLNSCVFVQQVNTVHGLQHRTNHQYNISPERLNELWLDGYEIDLNQMDLLTNEPNCTHGEREFFYRKS